jgi:hypothetical protein
MQSHYQVRWVTRRRLEELKKAGRLGQGLFLNLFSGAVVVEPAGGDLGDGPVLSEAEAEYELQPV